jgi:hypothetical protein
LSFARRDVEVETENDRSGSEEAASSSSLVDSSALSLSAGGSRLDDGALVTDDDDDDDDVHKCRKCRGGGNRVTFLSCLITSHGGVDAGASFIKFPSVSLSALERCDDRGVVVVQGV